MVKARDRSDPEVAKAEDEVIAILRAKGWSVPRIGRGLRRSINHIQRRVSALGLARAVLDPAPSLEGEAWVERPELGVRVSNLGRFASLKTGQILSISRSRGRDYVTVCTGQPGQTTRGVHLLVAESFGLPDPHKSRPYAPEEDAGILSARTFKEAYAALPGRSPSGIKRRAQVLKHKLVKGRRMAEPSRPRALKGQPPARERSVGPVRGSVPYLDPLWAEAHAVIPRAMPEHIREDLISDMVLLRLEGSAGSWRELAKLAIRERNRLVGAYKERSLDAPLSAGSDLRLIDVLADDCVRY